MDFAAIQAELAHLVGRIHHPAEDRHELYLVLRERLSELRAYQMPVPEDLIELEAALAEEFQAELPATNDAVDDAKT